MMGKGYKSSFWDDKNVLKLTAVMAMQYFKYTRPWKYTLEIIELICELCLNKAITKKTNKHIFIWKAKRTITEK